MYGYQLILVVVIKSPELHCKEECNFFFLYLDCLCSHSETADGCKQL